MVHTDYDGSESILTDQEGLDRWMNKLIARERAGDYIVGSWLAIEDPDASQEVVNRFARLFRYAGSYTSMLDVINNDQTYSRKARIQFDWKIESILYVTETGLMQQTGIRKYPL